MIIRDESVNLKSNLPLWATFTSYFVFMVDERNSDDSMEVIRETLTKYNRPYHWEYYTFSGFGPARTASLSTAWNKFPNASHVMIADPDWRPRLDTISTTHLNFDYNVLRFIVFDRSGVSNRRMDWLLYHRPSLAMRYHLHEVLDIGPYNVTAIPWVFDEIEQLGTWHATVGHGNSMTSKRMEFDLSLLQKDLTVYGHDPHVHYYLGITYHSYANKVLEESGVKNYTVADKAIHFSSLRLMSTYEDEFIEERWASMYCLADLYEKFKGDAIRATYWLKMCRDYNPSQVDCSLALVRHHMVRGHLDEAESELILTLQQQHRERAMLNNLGAITCHLPLTAVKYYILKYSSFGSLRAEEAKYTLLLVMILSNLFFLAFMFC